MPTVIYHANCPDGFLAAFTCWLQFGDRAEYVPANYNQSTPLTIPITDDIYIVDFSLPKDILAGLAEGNPDRQIIVLDHHKSAQENLQPLIGLYPNLNITFDMNKCGSMLTWEFFNDTIPAPPIYNYVQDRDLWQWKLPFSREISAALSLEPKDFQYYHDYIYRTPLERLISRGELILKIYENQINRLVKNSFITTIAGYTVRTVNSPILQSEICEKLIEMYLDIPFAACFSIKDGKEIWSLRSKGDFDVSIVARTFGSGGGHRNAARFTKEFDYFG